jgi:hypothetical protein
MGRCIDKARSGVPQTAAAAAAQLPDATVAWMAGDRHVLRLQLLLLLAFQAKLLAKEQGLASCVRCLQPGASSQPPQQQQPGLEQPRHEHAEHEQQQQEQEQQSEADEEPVYYANSDWFMNHVHVPGDHQLLLSGYSCDQADLAALEQQHLAAMHQIR